jgi:aryl-alcohol dehydrogenase-like predicted oxidoreductase
MHEVLRTLGDLQVGPIGLGCMGMSRAYDGAIDRPEALATLHAAIDGGVTLLDTADMYGSGSNEELIGEVLRTRRDEVAVATKFGIVTDPNAGSGLAPIIGVDGTPANARQSVEASLRRLGADTIDLYYLHRVDPTVPIEESVGAMAGMVERGQVRYLGLSECSAEDLRRANTVHPISAVQSEWSILSRDVEEVVVPTARELGVGLVPYSPLGRGFLTGAATATIDLAPHDFRRALPPWQADHLDANITLLATVRHIAATIGATPGQVALAWLLAQGDDIVPIPGTKRRIYLAENLGATSVQLSPEHVETLSALRPWGPAPRPES